LKSGNQNLTTFLQKNPVVAGEGKTLGEDTNTFRMKVVQNFLQAGISIQKVDALRDLISEHSPFSLTDSSHLRTFL